GLTRQPDLDEKRDGMSNWRRTHERSVRRLFDRAKPWMILSDAPTPIVPIPGATTMFVELRRGATRDAAEAELAKALEAFNTALGRENGVWWLKLEPTGTLRAPAWGFAGSDDAPVLIGGWGPPCVIENRARMGAK
ncbi:MAG: hypothetical protein VYC34_03530, partial [Planctomycetota bacterium]|nr:hypothetical protein [Planctomycetota bacterium]